MSPALRHPMRLLAWLFTCAIGLATAWPALWQGSSTAPPDPRRVNIDVEHILQGRVNSQGDLVGVHHAPSAPRTLRVDGRDALVRIILTSPGGKKDVRTARVQLLDPSSRDVLREKTSTLFPDAWSADEIEAAIREAYGDARNRRRIDSRGRWQGRTRNGVRIDGYLTYDGRGIATAFPVYERRNERPNRR